MHDIPLFLTLLVAVSLGLALGSFTTCVVYRIPRGLSIWRQDKNQSSYRSFCPQCKTPLTALDLVPVFSWLFLRGRCRHCGKPIGTAYLMIEVAVLFLVTAIIMQTGISLTGIILCLLIPVLAGVWSFFVLKPRL